MYTIQHITDKLIQNRACGRRGCGWHYKVMQKWSNSNRMAYGGNIQRVIHNEKSWEKSDFNFIMFNHRKNSEWFFDLAQNAFSGCNNKCKLLIYILKLSESTQNTKICFTPRCSYSCSLTVCISSNIYYISRMSGSGWHIANWRHKPSSWNDFIFSPSCLIHCFAANMQGSELICL